MLLLRKLIEGNVFVDEATSGKFPFTTDDTVLSGWEDVSSIENWDLYWERCGLGYNDVRNHLITEYEPDWGTLSDDDKKTLIRHFVYPSETGDAELDALYTDAERKSHLSDTMKRLVCLDIEPRRSSTPGSIKYFNETIDDTGTITATEVVPDVVITLA